MIFYPTNQPRTPCFPVGLLKTESELLDELRLTYGDLKWWYPWLMLMIIFFLLSQTWPVTLRKQEKVFSGFTCHLIVRRLNLGVATKKLFYQHVKKHWCSFEAMVCIKFAPTAMCRYSRGSWVSLAMTYEFTARVTNW